jgi:hypothetical protein
LDTGACALPQSEEMDAPPQTFSLCPGSRLPSYREPKKMCDRGRAPTPTPPRTRRREERRKPRRVNAARGACVLGGRRGRSSTCTPPPAIFAPRRGMRRAPHRRTRTHARARAPRQCPALRRWFLDANLAARARFRSCFWWVLSLPKLSMNQRGGGVRAARSSRLARARRPR